MKYFVNIILGILVVLQVRAAYDPSQSSKPYQYHCTGGCSAPTSWVTVNGGYAWNKKTGHNTNASNATNRNRYVNFLINDNGAYDLSCYDWYVEVFSIIPGDGFWTSDEWTMESIGTVNLNQLLQQFPTLPPSLAPNNASPGMSFTQQTEDPKYKFLSVSFADFSNNDINPTTCSFRIVVIKKSGGSCGTEEIIREEFFDVNTWSLSETYELDFTPSQPDLKISVPDIAANICEGSISDVRTIATVSNADAGGPYSITLADGGGASTFNPSYATVSGDTIKIAPNCPAGNYTVKATVTDAASNTAGTTFAFTVNAKPDITISANPGTTICKDDALTLSITDAKSVANQYAWDVVPGTYTDGNISLHNAFSTSNATYSAAPEGTMTYQAVAKSAAGCLDTTELAITVNEAPLANLTSSDLEVCSGETITLTVTEATGSTTTADSWEWVNPAVATTTNTVTVTPTNTGNAQIQVTYKVKSVKGTCKSAEFTTTVRVNPQPNLSVTNQPVAQCEGTQVDLSSATLGGASGLTLSYYSDANCTVTAANLQTVALADSPKSFWVVGKNPTTGCSDTVELKATVNPNPAKPTITAPTEVCEGSTATLTVAGVTGATYKWYNNGGTQVGTGTSYTTPALTAADSYKVEVEVAGCKTMSDAHDIGINQKPTVTIPTIADACAGTEVDLQATLSGGTAPYSHYVWTIAAAHGGATLAVQSSDSTQVKATLGKGVNTLTLTVTDAKGCTGTDSQTGNGGYIQGSSLSADPNPFLAGTSTSLTLTATGSSAGNAGAIRDYDYSRLSPVPAHLGNTTAATYNPTVLPTAQTKYRVVMTTADGCKDSADVTVSYTARELEWVHLQGDTVCLADLSGGAVLQAKAHFGTQPYHYTWDNLVGTAGVQSQHEQGDSLVLTFGSGATPGVYSVNVKLTDSDPDSPKSITQTVRLVIGATPDVKINGDASADLAVCLNTTLNLTASTSLTEGVSYLWKEPSTLASSTNATQSVATTTVNTTGTNYKVVATSVYGCVDSAARKVIVNDLPTITLTANRDAVCPGGYVTVEVTSGGANTEYTWIGGATGEGKSKTVPISVATKFEVKRTDDNGCVATADTTIQVYVPEELVLSGDTTVCETANSLTLTASGLTGSGYYSWSSTPGGDLGNATSQSVTPTETTTYYVQGSDVHGCLTKTDSIVVKVDKMPTLTVKDHVLAACNEVDLYNDLIVSSGATVKYGMTANFTGGTVISASSPTVNTSATYYVRAENGVCKSDEDTVRVNVLTQPKLVVLSVDPQACEPDSIDLADYVDWTAGTGTTYDPVNLTYWDGEPGTAGSNQLASTKVYPGVGSKDYWVQGASVGCPSQNEKISVSILPKPVLAISAADTAVCTPTVDLSAAVTPSSVSKTYFRDAACTTAVGATVNTSGTYYVVGEDSGCRDTIDVTVRIKPHPAVSLTLPSDEVCKDETVQLTVNGGVTGDSYSWKVNGASVAGAININTYTTDPLTSNTTVGVTVTNTDGCTTDLDTTIEVHTPAVTLAADGDCQGDVVTITATLTGGTADTYTWTGATQSAAPNEHQATLTLTSAGQPVGVEVLTTDGCRAQADSVFTGRACIVLVVQVPDTTICSTEDNVKLTAHSSGGTVTSWAWRQIAGPVTLPSLTYTDSVLMLPSMTAGTYEFEVSVNGGVAKDTAHVTVEQGVEITSLVALDSCSNSVELQVVATNSTTYKWSVVKGSGTWYAVPGEGEDRKRLALDGGQTGYEVAVEVSNGGLCKASDTLSGHVYTGLTIAFQGDDTCGRDIQLPLKYQVNGVYGNIVAKYTYQPVSGTTVKDSVRITPPNSGFITGAQPGTYVLTEVYGTNAKGCVVKVNDTVKVGLLPEAELAENCLALHKDSTFNLNIANSGTFNYIWSASQSSDGVTWTAGGPGDGTTTNTIQGTMEDKDLQYIITATDPNVAKCKASDTAYIYRIPDAPVVEIDTFEDKRHIQLKWTAAAYADNYTVWSRKWDPYCLTGKDGNVYAAEATGTNITALSWPEPQMDSLEFYYLTANRTICGTEYKSVSTDTFGYARHIADATIAISPEAAMQNRANFAFQYAFPYIFDMSRYGIQTLRDFGNYISDGKVRRPLKAIGLWERDNYYTPGLWGWVAQNYTPMFGGQWGNRGTPALPEDLKVGQCVMIDIYADSIQEFVILGALNDAADVKFDIKNVVANTSHNLFYIPLRNILLDEAIKIAPAGSTLKASLVAMGFWVFDYNNLRTVNSVTIFGQDKFSADGSPSSAPYAFKKRAGYDVLSFDAGIISGTVNMMWP